MTVLAVMMLIARPVTANESQAAQAVMKNLIADNDLLATLFADQNIEPIGNDKAYVFSERDTVRYVVLVAALKSNIEMTLIAEPLCRSRLMTPEAMQIRQQISEKTSDSRLIDTILHIWQNSGQISHVNMNTQILPDEGMLVSICKARASDIQVNVTDIDDQLLQQAEIMIARQLYEYAAYDALIKRMQTGSEYLGDAETKAFHGLALLKMAEYEAAFRLDEEFDNAMLSDPWLKAEYESVFAKAIDAYFTLSLEKN